MRGRLEEKAKSLCLTSVSLSAERNGWNELKTPQVYRKPPSTRHREEEAWDRRDYLPFALLPQMVSSMQGNPAPSIQSICAESTLCLHCPGNLFKIIMLCMDHTRGKLGSPNDFCTAIPVWLMGTNPDIPRECNFWSSEINLNSNRPIFQGRETCLNWNPSACILLNTTKKVI